MTNQPPSDAPRELPAQWIVPSAPTRRSTMPPTIVRYQASWVDPLGEVHDLVRMGPCMPVFTGATSALIRGTLVQTENGPAAIEDLIPGDRIMTSAGPEPLLWKGSRLLPPNNRDRPIFRIPREALGPGRPMPDLVLGPAARLVTRQSSLTAMVDGETALVPVAALRDDTTVIPITPRSPVEAFHLGFARHLTFSVNGIEIESAHPGPSIHTESAEIRALFLSLFPHLGSIDDFGDLTMCRLSDAELLQTVPA